MPNLVQHIGRSSEQCKIDMLKEELAAQKKLFDELKVDYDLMLDTMAKVDAELKKVRRSGFFTNLDPMYRAQKLIKELFK